MNHDNRRSKSGLTRTVHVSNEKECKKLIKKNERLGTMAQNDKLDKNLVRNIENSIRQVKQNSSLVTTIVKLAVEARLKETGDTVQSLFNNIGGGFIPEFHVQLQSQKAVFLEHFHHLTKLEVVKTSTENIILKLYNNSNDSGEQEASLQFGASGNPPVPSGAETSETPSSGPRLGSSGQQMKVQIPNLKDIPLVQEIERLRGISVAQELEKLRELPVVQEMEKLKPRVEKMRDNFPRSVDLSFSTLKALVPYWLRQSNSPDRQKLFTVQSFFQYAEDEGQLSLFPLIIPSSYPTFHLPPSSPLVPPTFPKIWAFSPSFRPVL